MLTPEGRVKVLDFGLAKKTARAASDATATALSQPGLVIGTAGYMSPEQVRGEEVDSRSDIFSFGVVLYELVTGKRAFSGGSAVDTMHAVLHEDPPEASASDPGFSPALNTILRRCLEKRPDQRFQSAADLAFALRAISATAISAQHVTPVEPRAVARRKQSWLLPVLALAAGCAVFAAGYYLRDRTASKEPPIFQRITFRTGLVTNARFIPGGHNVVYSAKWETGPSRIYLATPGTPESRDLQMPEFSVVSAVSSKEEILFLAAPFFRQRHRHTFARLRLGRPDALLTGRCPHRGLDRGRNVDGSPPAGRWEEPPGVSGGDCRLEFGRSAAACLSHISGWTPSCHRAFSQRFERRDYGGG